MCSAAQYGHRVCRGLSHDCCAAACEVEGIDFSALEAAVFQETDLLTQTERQHAAAEPPQRPESDEIVESDAAWRATTWQRLFPLALVVPGATRLHGRSIDL